MKRRPMGTLKEFLTELAVNAQQLGAFIHDPDAAMEAAELSEEDKRALKSGFTHVIYARLAGMSTEEAFQIPPQPLDLFADPRPYFIRLELIP